MSMRIFSSFAVLLLVTACGRPDNEVLAEAEQRAAEQAPDDGKIECAINGDTEFTNGCEEERLSSAEGTTLIIRHPDGGFRRFNVLTDGRGLEAADGAETAQIEIVEDDKIKVSVGTDIYILNARMKAPAKPEEAAKTAEKPPAEPDSSGN